MMKIKANFHLPSKDFKTILYEPLTVTCSIDPTAIIQEDPKYTVDIPDYIYKELANSEPQFRTKEDMNGGSVSGSTVKQKFTKRQSSHLLSGLQRYIQKLTSIIVNRHALETTSSVKKIFISFKHTARHGTNGLNGAYWGQLITSNFRFFTGYEVQTAKYGETSLFSDQDRTPKTEYISKIFYSGEGASQRYKDTGFKDSDEMFLRLNAHNQSNEDFKKQFSIIDWTEEREEYCKKIESGFLKLNAELSNFLSNIDNNSFDQLMTQNHIKMIN